MSRYFYACHCRLVRYPSTQFTNIFMASITIGEIPSPSDAIKLDMLPPSGPNLLTGIELFPFLVLIFAEVTNPSI